MKVISFVATLIFQHSSLPDRMIHSLSSSCATLEVILTPVSQFGKGAQWKEESNSASQAESLHRPSAD